MTEEMAGPDHDAGRHDSACLVELGYLFLGQEKATEATAFFRQAVALDSDNADGHVGLGLALYIIGRSHDAVRHLRAATRLAPCNSEYHAHLGELLVATGRHGEAEVALNRALELDPRQADAHRHLGRLLRERDQQVDAEWQLVQATELDPINGLAHAELGLVLWEQRRLDAAAQALTRAVDLEPDCLSAHCWLAGVLVEQGLYGEAEAACRKAFALDTDCLAAYHWLATLLLKTCRFTEAAEALHHAIRIFPPDAGHRSDLSLVLLSLGRLDEAETTARTALEMDPESASGLAAFALVLGEQGRFTEAIALCENAVASGIRDARVHSALGWAALSQRRFDTAEHHLRTALELCPHRAVDWNNLAGVLTETGRWPEAEAAYAAALTEDPNYPAAYIDRAWLYLLQDNPDAAMGDLRRSLQLDPAGRGAARAQLLMGALNSAAGAPCSRSHFASALAAANRPFPTATYIAPFRLEEIKALSLAALGRTTEAITTLRHAMVSTPQDRLDARLYDAMRHAVPSIDELLDLWRRNARPSPSMLADNAATTFEADQTDLRGETQVPRYADFGPARVTRKPNAATHRAPKRRRRRAGRPAAGALTLLLTPITCTALRTTTHTTVTGPLAQTALLSSTLLLLPLAWWAWAEYLRRLVAGNASVGPTIPLAVSLPTLPAAMATSSALFVPWTRSTDHLWPVLDLPLLATALGSALIIGALVLRALRRPRE